MPSNFKWGAGIAMHRLVKVCNAVRLHVALVYALIAITFVWAEGIRTQELVAVLCFTSLLSASYLLNRITDVDSDRLSQPGEELEGNLVLFSVVLLAFVPLAFLVMFSLPVLPYITFIMVGAFYSLPAISGKSLREILILKNLYAAAAWYVSFALLESVYAGATSFLESLLSSPHVFALVLAYEIMLDIRDADADRAAGISTIPNTFGMVTTRLSLLTLFAWVLWMRDFDVSDPISVATVVLIPLSLLATPKTPRWVFHLTVYIMLAAVAVLVLW